MSRTALEASARTTTTYVYRGVHSQHPEIEAARIGTVIPGDIAGRVTPAEHNAGGKECESPYTSWTYSRAYAEKRAYDRGPGVVLRLALAAPEASVKWRWEASPDIFDEEEVLLFGIRMDAEVVK